MMIEEQLNRSDRADRLQTVINRAKTNAQAAAKDTVLVSTYRANNPGDNIRAMLPAIGEPGI
jgi:hypothetical protein